MVSRGEPADGMRAARREARMHRLRGLLAQPGAMRLVEAAEALGVSTMTVRRDLAAAPPGISLLGGHIVLQPAGSGRDYSLDAEAGSHAAAKREAAARAVRLVEPGDTIFVDCGTTMPYLVAGLPAEMPLTVVCYALNIAQAACALRRAQVFLLGGLFHASSATFFSEDALRSIGRIGIGKAFLSAGGLHQTQGASCSNFNEVPVKRAVLARALRAFLVLDSSKLGQVRPAQFAPASAFEQVLTELS